VKVHVRYLISWWVSCYTYGITDRVFSRPHRSSKIIPTCQVSSAYAFRQFGLATCIWINHSHRSFFNVFLFLSRFYVFYPLLWPPLRSNGSHYIMSLWFLSFFPRLFSAVADWMSTTLPHMMWPWREFRMQVWNVLNAARWNIGGKKFAIWAPSHNFVGLYFRN